MQANTLSNLKAILSISTQETYFVEEAEAKQVSLCCRAGCAYMLIRSCFTINGGEIAFAFRNVNCFIWHSLPKKAVSLCIRVGSLPAQAKLPTRKKT